MGQTSRELAAAAAAACPGGEGTGSGVERETRDTRSWASVGVLAPVETWEEMSDSEGAGERRLELRLCCCAAVAGFEERPWFEVAATAGESERPLPRMRPPPRERPVDMMSSGCRGLQHDGWEVVVGRLAGGEILDGWS
jgi:hypothetical protein